MSVNQSIIARLLPIMFIMITITACAQNKTASMTRTDYEKAWKEVADFEDKGLPESALKVVQQIYQQATQEKNAAQLVKAVIHQLKFTDYKEEEALVRNLEYLKLEADKAQFPMKPLLHSMLGDLYWQYYQNNRYRFQNRSSSTSEGTDITTWSLSQILSATFEQFGKSLENVEQSKTTSIQVYDDIMNKGNEQGRRYRPTLYDFLAHRALAFMKNDEAMITQPTDVFAIDQESYYAPAAEFIKLQISSEDTLSSQLFVLRLYQDLLTFHINDNDKEVLYDVDIERLQYVNEKSIHPDKAKVYWHAIDALEKQIISIPISTRVSYLKALVLTQEATRYKPLEGDQHQWDYKRAIEICDSAVARFKDSEGAGYCLSLKEDVMQKQLSAEMEEHNLSAEAFRSRVVYRNLTELHYRVVKITRDEVRSQRQKWERNYNVDQEEKFIEYFLGKTPAKSGQYKLPTDNDYQPHSIEVRIDALEPGEYMVIFSNKAGFPLQKNAVAYTFTTITNISYIHRNTRDGGTDVFVINRGNGAPMGGVKTTAYRSQYNYKTNRNELISIGSYTSDTKGYIFVPFTKSESRQNFILEFSYKGDFASMMPIDHRSYYYGEQINQYKHYDPNKHNQTHFFLDRAIYRPGQTIHFKGLVVNTDGRGSEIVAGYRTTVSLYDVNGQIKQSVDITSNEYGTYSGTFTAPASGLTGQMWLADNSHSGTVYFSVEEYKRPKFEVVFDTLEGTYRLNDNIKVEGHGKAYSGANIDGANVSYKVVRRARLPMWWYYRWSDVQQSPERQIAFGTSKTDENGKFTIDFKALPDLSIAASSDPTFHYEVLADVTDVNGETHSQSITVSVGYKSLQISTSIHDLNLDSLKSGDQFYITTSNMNGAFEPAKGKIVVRKLKDPGRTFRSRLWDQADKTLYTQQQYYQFFPHDQYADETNKYKWQRQNPVVDIGFNTADKKSFNFGDVKALSAGEYVLEMTSADKDGKEVKHEQYFSVYTSGGKTIPTTETDFFKPLVTTVEPGGKASFIAGTSEKSINVLYEVENDGRIISSQWLKFGQEQRLFSIDIKEEHRGNIGIHYTFTLHGRLYQHEQIISVPFSNKELDIDFQTFRDKLQPGAQEQWKLLVKGKNADKIMAEMVATLYDESLDEFRPNNWYAQLFSARGTMLKWAALNAYDKVDLTLFEKQWNESAGSIYRSAEFDALNWFEFNLYYSRRREMMRSSAKMKKESMPMAASPVAEMAADDASVGGRGSLEEREASAFGSKDKNKADSLPGGNTETDKQEGPGANIRKNFNETAFFFPHLQTNDKGEIVINFTIPEALTRWKMLGFAHTRDLKSGYATNQLVTQKELMVVPNQPRFFREGDKMMFSAKVTSLVAQSLSGNARLEFIDPFTGKSVNLLAKGKTADITFNVAANQSTSLEWAIEIPDGLQAVTYRIVAKAGNFSDGEEMTLPVVTNSMLVTESLPLPIRGGQTKDYTFDKLVNTTSTTRRNQQFTLEFTSNPAWYAVQALPYLMEYPYDCVEQTFSKYYANSLAGHIANSNPRIKQVFDTWKNIQPDALLSNLEKNQELKSALLEETPWVLQANDETQRKRNVALLFDLNKMASEADRALDKVAKAQRSSGGFSWFPGFPEDRYMTQHIVGSMGHLDALGVKAVRNDSRTWSMVTNAIGYLDREMKNDYDRLLALAEKKQIKLEEHQLSYFEIQYLYTRSFFQDVVLSKEHEPAHKYFMNQGKKYWVANKNIYLEGMLALAFHRHKETSIIAEMIRSFRERSLNSEEMGMYWKNDRGYYWYQAPIETQALMIEVFDEVANDQKAVDDLKVWLLKQKQTQDWKTTKATSEACYALLKRGTDMLTTTSIPLITVGGTVVDPSKDPATRVEAGTGYFKTAWKANEIKPALGKIHIEKKDAGVAWGAAYWQYFEQLDKITGAETPLKLKKDLFKVSNTNAGEKISVISKDTRIAVGDLIRIRIELRVDRNMEYVHLKDMRASGLEPTVTLSGHAYQDGLYYYQSTRDLATNFFMGYLPKGTYVFEYNLRASQKGDFSNGITTIQSMYAPEFSSHSQGVRISIQ